MPIEVLMPALSPTMEKGNLAKWLKKEGDAVKSGDVIAEIETDKATMEVEAVDEGTLGKILVQEGTADVAVNTPIAVLLGDDIGDVERIGNGRDAAREYLLSHQELLRELRARILTQAGVPSPGGPIAAATPTETAAPAAPRTKAEGKAARAA